MLSQALLQAVPARHRFDRLMLAVHGTMLEHGFVCTGTSEPAPSQQGLTVASSPDGGCALQVLPAGWNSVADHYTFGYMHPARGASEAYTLKALVIGENLMVHAASSLPGAELLTASFTAPRAEGEEGSTGLAESTRKEVHEKMASGIVLRLLARQPATSALGQALDTKPQAEAAHGTKRPAPRSEDEQDRRDMAPTGGRVPPAPFPDVPPVFPGAPHFDPDLGPVLWTPHGGLLGPRHPAWGQGVPVGGPRGGGRFGPSGPGSLMPRFSPIGPGGGEPDPDHLRVPGPLGEMWPRGSDRGRSDAFRDLYG